MSLQHQPSFLPDAVAHAYRTSLLKLVQFFVITLKIQSLEPDIVLVDCNDENIYWLENNSC